MTVTTIVALTSHAVVEALLSLEGLMW